MSDILHQLFSSEFLSEYSSSVEGISEERYREERPVHELINPPNLTSKITKMKDCKFSDRLFSTFKTGTALDPLLSSESGQPRGTNTMVIGDPGVGKTTVMLDMLANIQTVDPDAKVLFVSAEMTKIDMAIYVKRYPKFDDIDMLFIEDNSDVRNIDQLTFELQKGWDIVAIDSFYELQGIVKEEQSIRATDAETMLIKLMKQHNEGGNQRGINTSFLVIQQVTKQGGFVGSNRLKHAITSMMELRLDNPKNIYSERYVVFTKHRRGDVSLKLYYSLAKGIDVYFDSDRFEQEKKIRQMQKDNSADMDELSNDFNNLFTNNNENFTDYEEVL